MVQSDDVTWCIRGEESGWGGGEMALETNKIHVKKRNSIREHWQME
jgi:hypothetical protein